MTPIDIMLNRKTIREFKPARVSPAHLSILIDVAKRTASSLGMQSFSIIRIVDPTIKKEIAEVCQQDYVARLPELFIFIVDCYRNSEIAKAQGIPEGNDRDADRFMQGWTDASLAAQNMSSAAELAGFGTVFLGSILNDAPKIIELLGLPKLTFPVVGLGLGTPDQKPQLKPRMPREANVFDDKYTVFDNYMTLLEVYDEEMEEYYDLRDTSRRVDSFTKQVAQKTAQSHPKRSAIIEQARAQGFNL